MNEQDALQQFEDTKPKPEEQLKHEENDDYAEGFYYDLRDEDWRYKDYFPESFSMLHMN